MKLKHIVRICNLLEEKLKREEERKVYLEGKEVAESDLYDKDRSLAECNRAIAEILEALADLKDITVTV